MSRGNNETNDGNRFQSQSQKEQNNLNYNLSYSNYNMLKNLNENEPMNQSSFNNQLFSQLSPQHQHQYTQINLNNYNSNALNNLINKTFLNDKSEQKKMSQTNDRTLIINDIIKCNAIYQNTLNSLNDSLDLIAKEIESQKKTNELNIQHLLLNNPNSIQSKYQQSNVVLLPNNINVDQSTNTLLQNKPQE